MKRETRGQVTIFVIVAILIVVGILIFFLWLKPAYIDGSVRAVGFEGCMKSAVEDTLGILGLQGGFSNPELYYLYKNDRIGYLCYTNLYHQTCVVQKPFVKQHFEEELIKATRDEIFSCYSDAVDEMKVEGYEVESGEPSLDINIEPDKIKIILDAPVFVSRGGAGSKFTRFNSAVDSPFYDMLMVANSILQYEARYGDSETTLFMNFYPDFVIDKIKRSEGTTIYVIEDRITKTKFQFASRSLAWPAGYIG